jgi:hypothetical protein
LEKPVYEFCKNGKSAGVTGDYMFNLKTRELFSRAREDSLGNKIITYYSIFVLCPELEA